MQEPNSPGKIILINGTSSSGKTSLIRAFQAACPEPFLEMGIDKFIWMLPHRYLDRPLWDDVLGQASAAGALGHALARAMHRAIAAAARSGMNVIADHVLVESAWVQDCREQFAGLPVWWVGLHCSLECLETRERARTDRTLGQARRQFPIIHAYTQYDLLIDAEKNSPEQSAQNLLALVTGAAA